MGGSGPDDGGWGWLVLILKAGGGRWRSGGRRFREGHRGLGRGEEKAIPAEAEGERKRNCDSPAAVLGEREVELWKGG